MQPGGSDQPLADECADQEIVLRSTFQELADGLDSRVRRAECSVAKAGHRVEASHRLRIGHFKRADGEF
jgi:hypothetical protein